VFIQKFYLFDRDSQEATDTFADPNLLQNLQSNHVCNLLHYQLINSLMCFCFLGKYRVYYFGILCDTLFCVFYHMIYTVLYNTVHCI